MTPWEEKGTRKALIIGISDYDDKRLQPLKFCRKDATEMYTTLLSLNYHIAGNHLLVGHIRYESIRAAIIDFFTDAGTKAEDTLLLYFSGHGIPDIDGDVYFASSDINPDQPFIKGFSFNDLTTKMIPRSYSRRIVIILDCCYSGQAKIGKGLGDAKGQEDSAATLGTAAINKEARNIPQGEGRCLLAASQGFQEAYALRENDHSIFTYYLLEGLKGNQESVDIHGYVTPFTLGNYVFKSIVNLPPAKRPKQQPLIKAEVGGDIVLADYPKADRQVSPPKPKKGHKRIIAVGVILGSLIVALLAASQMGVREDNSFTPFSSYEDHGIFMIYPNEWIADASDRDSDDDIIPISFGPSEGNRIVWIFIQDEVSESISEYLDSLIDYREDNGHEIIERDTDVELAGRNGYSLVSTYDDDGIGYKQMEIGTIDDNRLYSIIYSAPSRSYNFYLEAANEMIDSFRISQ